MRSYCRRHRLLRHRLLQCVALVYLSSSQRHMKGWAEARHVGLRCIYSSDCLPNSYCVALPSSSDNEFQDGRCTPCGMCDDAENKPSHEEGGCCSVEVLRNCPGLRARCAVSSVVVPKCTDKSANNYREDSPGIAVEDGSCEYSNCTLLKKAEGLSPAAECYIFSEEQSPLRRNVTSGGSWPGEGWSGWMQQNTPTCNCSVADAHCRYNCPQLYTPRATNRTQQASLTIVLSRDGHLVRKSTVMDQWIIQGKSQVAAGTGWLSYPDLGARIQVIGAELRLRFVRIADQWQRSHQTCTEEPFCKPGGGAIYAFYSTLSIVNVIFANNSAIGYQGDPGALPKGAPGSGWNREGGWGGAIQIRMSNVTIDTCLFTNNGINSTSDAFGGALYSECSNMNCTVALFENNSASRSPKLQDCFLQNGKECTTPVLYGNDVSINSQCGAAKTHLQSTSFLPFHEATSMHVRGSWLESIGGCQENPGDLGYRCTYQDYSLWFARCPDGTIGQDGFSCTPCKPGHEPFQGNSTQDERPVCRSCSGNAVSKTGAVCIECPKSQLASNDHTTCTPCPIHQEARSGSCGCSPGFYDGSSGLIMCFDNGYDAQLVKEVSEQFHSGHCTKGNGTLECPQCLQCPYCADCSSSEPAAKPGYVTSSLANARHIFACDDVAGQSARAHCPNSVPLSLPSNHSLCAEQYTGHFCFSCAEDYSHKGKDCVECDSADSQISTIIISVLFLAVVSTFCCCGSALCSCPRKKCAECPYPQKKCATSRQAQHLMLAPEPELKPEPEPEPQQQRKGPDLEKPLLPERQQERNEEANAGAEPDQAYRTASDCCSEFRCCQFRGSILLKMWHALNQPVRITITYFQVCSVLGQSLRTPLPQDFRSVAECFDPVFDTLGFYIDMNCQGWNTFVVQWLLRVVFIPLVLFVFSLLTVFVHLLVQRWANKGAEPDQASCFKKTRRKYWEIMRDRVFFAVFCLYPSTCYSCFAAFNCKYLSDTASTLQSDDTLLADCGVFGKSHWTDASGATSHLYIKGCSILVLFCAIVFPLCWVAKLAWDGHHYEHHYGADCVVDQVDRIAKDVRCSKEEASLAHRDIIYMHRVAHAYSFFTKKYDARKKIFFVHASLVWEFFGMMRKLLLVGLVPLVGRGSPVHIAVALCISFVFFALHAWSWPFKMSGDNYYQASTEGHIFIVILVSLVRKATNRTQLNTSLDPFGTQSNTADTILMRTFILMVIVGFMGSVTWNYRSMKDLDFYWDADTNKDLHRHRQKLQMSFGKFVKGVYSARDVEILRGHFNMIEESSDIGMIRTYMAQNEEGQSDLLYWSEATNMEVVFKAWNKLCNQSSDRSRSSWHTWKHQKKSFKQHYNELLDHIKKNIKGAQPTRAEPQSETELEPEPEP